MCLKAFFLERLMKEYEWNAFGHISSVAGNTRNKFASFSYLDMGTRPLFRVFHFLNFGLQYVQKHPSKSLQIYSGEQDRTTEHWTNMSLKYIVPNG